MRFTISRTTGSASDTRSPPHPDARRNTAIVAEPSYDNADEQWVIDVDDLSALLTLAGDEQLLVSPWARRDPHPHIEIYDDYRE